MQTTKTSKTAWFFAMLLCFGLGSAQAASITNADAAVNLNLGGSWVGGTPAGSSDVAVWNNLVQVNTAKALGADLSWAGIQVVDPGQPIVISPNVSAAPVTATLNSPTFTYSSAPAIPLANGNPAFLGGTTAPTGFTLNSNYFAVNATATTFQLSATSGGAAITVGAATAGTNVTVTGTGGPTLTLGASGVDMSLATTGLTLGCPIVLGADQTWNVTSGQTLTVRGQLGASTATTLTLTGSGINNFSSLTNGAYTGNFSVNNGAVLIPGGQGLNGNSALGTGIITNNNGATLRSANKIVGNALVFNGTSTIDAALVSFTLDGDWSGSGTVIITNMSTNSTVTAGGQGNGGGTMNNFTGTILISSTNSDGVTPTAGAFRFNNGGGAGSGPNFGNINATFDLGQGSASLLMRNRGTIVNLGALKGGPNTSISAGTTGSGTITYSIGGNNANTTYAGRITNSSTVVLVAKVGSGTLTLTGPNGYTGPTTVNNGVLQVGDGVTTGAGTLGTNAFVLSGGTLLYNKPDDFAITNNISGSGGTLVKTNTDIMTYNGTNTASSATVISQGTLLLGASGNMSCPVFVASGATFDVSLNSTFNNILSGFGTVNGLLTSVGGTISPGGGGAAGTLSFANGLTENGSVNHLMELSKVGGTNDLINITGNLTATGVNNFTLSHFGGGSIPNGTYTLIAYSGSISGSLANFTVSAAGNTCVLSNLANQITVTVFPPPRPVTNLTWVGDNGANNWDLSANNWVNGATSLNFQTGDSVRFDAAGAANPTVDLTVPVSPASVVVSNTASYTFTGAGNISGATGLVKTNSGTLSVLTTNSYTGPTIIGGGTLAVSTLANGTLISGIGASSSNPTNLVFFGSTFRYTGPTTSTDRGATLNGSGGTFDVIGGTILTLNGTLTGPGALIVNGGDNTAILSLANPNTYAGGTILSNGVLALGSNSANNDGAGGSGVGAITNPVTFYGGTLQLYGYGLAVGLNYNTFYNPLVVPAGQTGTLIMFPRGPANSGAGSGLQSSLTGGGILNLVVNYLRDDLSGNWSAFTGLINATAANGADEMRINNNFGYASASIFLNDGVTMDRATTANTTNDIGALDGTGLAVIGPGVLSGPNPTWRVGWKNTDATFAGVIADDGSTKVIKVGSGRWALNGYNTYTGPTIISNGVLAVLNGLASTNINVGAGAFLDVSTAGTLSLATGQTLGGNGTVLGSVDASGGGTIAPGSSIGTLTVTNTVTLGGNTLMEINRDSVPNSDKLAASAISLGGTLTVENIGPALHIGDTFDLFDGALSGSFATNKLVSGYYTWNTSQLAAGGNGTITVTSVSLPTLGVTVSGTNIVLNSSGGLSGGQLTVVTSTDVSAPLSTWTTVTNDVFNGSGNYSLTIPINSGIVKQFYVILVF